MNKTIIKLSKFVSSRLIYFFIGVILAITTYGVMASFTSPTDYTAVVEGTALTPTFWNDFVAEVRGMWDYDAADNIYTMKKVGIGTTPSAQLDVLGEGINIYNSGGAGNTDSLYITTHPGEGRSMAIHHAGIGNIMEAYGYSGTWGSGSWNNVFTITPAGDVIINKNGTDYMGFHTTGSYFDIKTHGTNQPLWINYDTGNNTAIYNKLAVGTNTSGMGSYTFWVKGSAFAEGGTWNPSDIRLKKNIKDLDKPLEKLLNLKGVEFEWKNDEFPKGKQIGIIAQDMEKEFPELVKEDGSGYKAVAYDKLTAILIEAVKSQQSEIQKLEKRITTLETIKK